MKILCFIEHRENKIKRASLEALNVAVKILNGNLENIAGVIIGNHDDSIITELNGYGADIIFSIKNDALSTYNSLNYFACLELALKDFSPDIIIGATSVLTKDLFPKVAAKFDAALITDVVKLSTSGAEIVATKPMYAGKVLAQIVPQNAKLKIISIRPNVFSSEKVGLGSANIKKLDHNLSPQEKLKNKEVHKSLDKKIDLTDASVIVSGGRGLQNADAFKLLFECAEVLGGAVGASRAAVDSGWASHNIQVGQTGKTVNPNLYIACGISGSVQHLAGMQTSKTIVAINNNPEAPIFNVADYGIVADLFEAVPILTQKLKECVSG